VSRAERPLADTALLVTDIATILGAGHSIGLIAHRTVALLQGTSLAPRVNVHDESGCEYVADPTAACDTDADGTFTLRLQGSDRRVTIAVRRVEAIEEISLLKSVSDVVQVAMNRTA
jgi:hypothetical protein